MKFTIDCVCCAWLTFFATPVPFPATVGPEAV
jgi:hypothetical protein